MCSKRYLLIQQHFIINVKKLYFNTFPWRDKWIVFPTDLQVISVKTFQTPDCQIFNVLVELIEIINELLPSKLSNVSNLAFCFGETYCCNSRQLGSFEWNVIKVETEKEGKRLNTFALLL